MSLPLSPPPSRSASQASFHKNEHAITTYATSSATTSISSSPLTPSSMTSPVSPGTRRPTLSIPTSPQTATFLTSATPNSTACSDLRSFFSPCSSDEDDDDDDDSDDNDEEIGTPSAQVKPKGHFQRLWASRDPPSTPPSCPPPPVPRRPSALGSPTFGWRSQGTEDDGVPDSWYTRPSIRESIRSAPAVLPVENRLSPTWQPPTPPSPAIVTGGTAEAPLPTDPFLSSLHSILASQLQSLTPLLTSPHQELAAARLARDKLLVKTQKAYFRRASVSGLRVELQAAEERVRQIERSVVTQFLGVLEGIVEGVKDGCETAMAAEDAAYQEWEQGKQGLDGCLECPPLEIVTESRPRPVAQTSSEETIVPFTRPSLPPAPQPPQLESPLPSPKLSKLSPSPHPNSSPTLSTATSISSSTTASPSSSPISRGRGRLRGGTFGYEACTCENASDHDCANESWPWDPLVVKVGDVEMRMI
ncbi:hypothetical protein HOY82DRAFT_569574 [Tuber indicum]|nr:hypothetical protein HOY82DRAFT_569574 [Tuber indicum]